MQWDYEGGATLNDIEVLGSHGFLGLCAGTSVFLFYTVEYFLYLFTECFPFTSLNYSYIIPPKANMKFLLLLTAATGLHAIALPRGILERNLRRESTGITGKLT